MFYATDQGKVRLRYPERPTQGLAGANREEASVQGLIMWTSPSSPCSSLQGSAFMRGDTLALESCHPQIKRPLWPSVPILTSVSAQGLGHGMLA